MAVLVAGGAGFIGSHTSVELLERGDDIVIVDNFSNSKPEVLNRIKKITGKDLTFCLADLCDYGSVDEIFAKYSIDSVIHFAGYKAVGESVEKPLMYYENNLISTFNILRAMKKYGCKAYALFTERAFMPFISLASSAILPAALAAILSSASFLSRSVSLAFSIRSDTLETISP